VIVRKLQPIRAPEKEFEEIEKRLKRLFLELVYRPILKDLNLPEKAIFNSVPVYPALNLALSSGRLTFNQGVFSGKFNGAVSKELRDLGAKWDFGDKVFRLNKDKLPVELTRAIDLSETRFVKKLDSIDHRIEKVLYESPWDKFNFSDLFDKSIFKVDKEFRKNVEKISIQPKVSDEQAKKISEMWQSTFKIKCKDFGTEQMLDLREKVKKAYLAGDRYGTLVKTFQTSYGISERKAEFWARNETRSLVSAYQGARYVEAGVPGYHWKAVTGSSAHPTRHRHRELSDMSAKGQVFYWNDPPRVTELGAKGPVRYENPGGDYNCRCTGIPVVERKSK